MYKLVKEVDKSKKNADAAAVSAMMARLDYLYNYAKDAKVEEKKGEYVKRRDEHRRMVQEFEAVVKVPNAFERTGVTPEMLQKSSLKFPIDSNSSAYNVFRDMEERLWKVKYAVPSGVGENPNVADLLWIK